jgi:hypothetical protein
MRAREFITERKKRKKNKKIRKAAYGPGPYGWYGYDAGYSGDGGGDAEESLKHEAVYPGNIGAMEVAQFFMKASPEQKDQVKKLIADKEYKSAWNIIQTVLNVRLHGKEFA